jgi:Tetratricopeptide repeat
MRMPGARMREAMRNPDRPALVAVDGVLGALWHWSSAVSVLVIVPVAHLLAVHGGDQAGTVLQASFAVFALLLPAVALLRDYFKKRTDRLHEVLRERRKILDERADDNIQRADKGLNESFRAERKIFKSLEAQQKIFERLGRTVSPLQRGVVLTIVATLASSAAVVAPTSTLWKHAPRWLVFNLTELLTAIALVCLAGAVVAMLPFTWYLLIGPGEVDQARETAASVPEPPSSNLNEPLNDQVGLTYDNFDETYANTCLAGGKFADAIQMLEQLLARRVRLLGSNNPSTLRTRDRLASAYLQVGRAADAIPIFEKLYDAWKQVLSPRHSETLRARDNLAAARWSVARAADEIPAFERLLIDRERVFGPDHSETLRARDNLADAYLTAGRVADAILVFERIAADREQAYGSGHRTRCARRKNSRMHAWRQADWTTELRPLVPAYLRR